MTSILQAAHVRVDFGSLLAVEDVSFELEGGQLLGLVGPNGAGKTTLLRVLAGLQVPTYGAGLVMGRAVLSTDESVRRHIGFAADSPPVYEELTVRQFLLFIAGCYGLARSDAEERIAFWLEQLWLEDKKDTRIRELSKGMRQRITLARTFLPNPNVILLDEPLTGLDPKGRIQLRDVLVALRQQGCAMIVSSHILSDLEAVATHIMILERGKVIRFARADQLHDTEILHRSYRITLRTDDNGAATAVLAGVQGVQNVRREGRAYICDYSVEEEAGTDLLRDLVRRDLPVLYFEPVRESLEQVYMRAGVRQVD